MADESLRVRVQERENLRHIIQQWNANRLELFEISEPDESLEFHGVIRFYFQDLGQKVATKCLRVVSNATTREIIEVLIQKFRADIGMLSTSAVQYTLYEVHEMGERRLGEDEKPLLVQLNWNRDDREGRFLLRRVDMNGLHKLKTLPPMSSTPQPSSDGNFIRKLSRREKKELKKQEKIRRAIQNNENDPSVAEKLYTELPETSFTRSISNPEAVMRRRRAQKLEKKLQQFRSKDGGPDTGGTLKIYGESLCKDVPYKTLLLSVRDNAFHVVKEMLDKYGLYREDPINYCLVQCIVTPEETLDGYQGQIIPQKEYILDDEECPLAILMNHTPSAGSIMFQVRRRPADHGQRRRKKKPLKGSGVVGPHHQHPRHHPSHHGGAEQLLLPFLVELEPDGSEIFGGKGQQHQLHLNVTEVGSDKSAHSGGQSLQLFGPHIQPRHCVIAHTDGIVTVTPCSRDAETHVNFQRIYETTILQHGAVVSFGRTHTFRFIDPQNDDRLRLHLTPQKQIPPPHSHQQQLPYQDRFGQESGGRGDAFSAPLGSRFGSRSSSLAGSQTSIARPPLRSGSEIHLRSPPGTRNSWDNYARFGPPRDPILPAVLEFREDVEDAFLHNIITQLDPTDIQFKLAPTYTLYMAARFRASTHYRPELSPTERAEKLTEMLTKVSSFVHKVIELKQQRDATALAFWMANASELLNFLKQDRHICGYSLDAQDILAEAVQFAYRKLVEYMQTELSSSMPQFLEDRDDQDEEEGCSAHVLSILTNTMALLRRCRVNAALTIQLFSQLFHFINMWVFNRIVSETEMNFCTREWGDRIKERLSRVELWAEKQGLELAADCHLVKLSQAALLLTADKSSADNVTDLSTTCFKLNSLQLRQILESYELEHGEPSIPKEFIDNVVSVAETSVDALAREDGREIRLEEESDLQLPFLLPEDGYSCDILRGVPSGLTEFLDPLQRTQLCRMTPQPTSTGLWTIYMHNHQDGVGQRPPPGPRSPSAMSNRSISIPRGEPEITTIQLKKINMGCGLSIVATKRDDQDQYGIYIKSVVPGGAADQDGRLQPGDQLLSVDGTSLVGISQEEAASYMVGTGPIVTLEVARQGAFYHGLGPLLSPHISSPVNRGPPHEPPRNQINPEHSSLHNLAHQYQLAQKVPQSHHHQLQHTQPPPPGNTGPLRLPSSGGDQPLLHTQRQSHPYTHPRIQAAKSVPSLTSDAGGGAGNTSAQQEAFNPSYSRASSSTSLTAPGQQSHNYPIRSKSTQNLSEGTLLSLTNRHPSNPTLPSSEDDRPYQNISFHQGHQDPRMGSQRGGRPAIFVPQQSDMDRPAADNRPTSAFMHRDDFRMEHLQRPSSQQQNARPDMSFGPLSEDSRKRFSGTPQHSPAGVTLGPGSPPSQNPLSPPSGGPRRVPASRGFPGPHTGQGRHPNPSYVLPPQQISPQYANSPQSSDAGVNKNPPPTAPKPNRGSGSHIPELEKPLRHMSLETVPLKHAGGMHKPPPATLEEGYRDSPPPPPPPTSTHPLLQSASPAAAAAQPFPSPSLNNKGESIKSPWQRQEKEQYEMRKREAIRQWRDEQIAALEQLEDARSMQEDERLNTLRLERQFQRRAEEAQRDDEDEDEDEQDEEDEERERDQLQEDQTPASQLHPHWQQQQQHHMALIEGSNNNNNNNDGNPVEERTKKAHEILRKQQELEAAKEAEVRLLREAQRRQEEEVRRHHHIQQHQQQRHQHHASQRLDTLVGAPPNSQEQNPSSPFSNGPINGGIQPLLGYADDANVTPQPPERASSYSIMQSGNMNVTDARQRGEQVTTATSTIKRVQFSEDSPMESRRIMTYDDNANQEKISSIREDPNNFIYDAENLLNSNSPKSPSSASTPGVIGAQEVYRDPRQRRLMEQAQKAAASRSPGPEKLTFREKMKMFAMETGESSNGAPQDKVKHSKAQREIDDDLPAAT